jgi:hypothetical protein
MEDSQFETLSILINFFSLATSVSIAVLLYFASKKIDTQNYTHSIKNAWIALDTAVLSNEQLLVEADYLLHPEKKDEPIEVKRRRWVCYLYLNTISTVYNGIKHKLIEDPKAANASIVKSLEGLTQHPEFMEMSEYFYEDELKDLCRKLHAKNQINYK